MPNPYIKSGATALSGDPDLVLSTTHPDWASTLNSAPTVNNVIPGSAPLAPGANQLLTVTGGSGSTANPLTDTNRKVLGQIPATSVAFSNPA
jgi:hypothetical protein